MIRYYGRPDRVALAMIDALQDGRVQTQGQWISFIERLQGLPPSLRAWTIDRIRETVGDITASNLLSMIPEVPA